jgi:hypothetical protein
MNYWVVPKEGRSINAYETERDQQLDFMALYENVKGWNWGVIDELADRDLIIKGTILQDWMCED